MENNSLTPEQKAAAVIVSLGAEKASKVNCSPSRGQ